MLIRWKGEELGEYRGLPRVNEARNIKKWTGLNPMQFLEAAMNFDPDAFAAFVTIMHQRAGKQMRISEVDGEFTDLKMELDDEEKTDQAEQRADAIQPVVKRILEDLEIDLDDDRIREVVMSRLTEAQDDAEGNAEGTAESVS